MFYGFRPIAKERYFAKEAVMFRRSWIATAAAAAAVLAFAGGAVAQDCPTEPTLQHYTGAGNTACPCFAPGEQAGVVFAVPAEHFPIEVLRVGVGWGSLFGGNPAQIEQALHVYDGRLPNPGVPVFSLLGPQLNDGVINEFNLELLGTPVVVAGPSVAVTLEFYYTNANIATAPTVVHDGNGCQPGVNLIRAVPGGWFDACQLGVSGDWVFHLVYRQVNCLTGVDDGEHTVTSGLPTPRLLPCYPNPFNPQTTIAFELPRDGRVAVTVHTLAGETVATLVNGERTAGRHEVVWSGRDADGRPVPSGVYLYRLVARDHRESRRMVLLK
jgi:hypothetical protein